MTDDQQHERTPQYDTERIRTAIDRAVRPQDDASPVYYTVTGSHIYGFPSEDGGDIDVRGFHLAPAESYLKLNTPREQFVVNQDGVTEGFEDYADIDLVSYELKKFTSLLYSANYNVLEVVFEGTEIMNGSPLEIQSLRALIEEELPLDVPKTYFGMAKSNYWKFLNPNSGKYRPTAKKYLYVIRGLLGSEYTRQEATIQADITNLAAWWGDDDLQALVTELIETKRASEKAMTTNEQADRADAWITRLFNHAEPPEEVDKTRYQERLNDWMLKVRA